MRTFTGNTWRLAAAVLGLSLFVACGSDDGGGRGGPTTPSDSGPGPSGATITVGQSVTFVNNDSRSHELASDPHPAHNNCPSINALAVLGTGQTRLTNSFGAAGTCGFHDHNDPDNINLKGTITIR